MIRILLLDDHALVRTGYRRLLDAEAGFQVVAEAASTDDACACLARGGIDVAVVDLSLRGCSGIEAIRRMLARDDAIKVLVLTMHDHAGYVTQAMRAGALGYLTKSSEPTVLFDAIRAVAAGRRTFSDDVRDVLARASLDADQALARLTPREFEILRLAVSGDSSADIASSMHLSPKTVHNHLSAIRGKLEADNDFKLIHEAVRLGLVAFPTPGA
ncbi:response regulator transcription factor [Thauera sp. 2A1]|uniref:response regulator n=1 Tax=Thauera sp. 2A1 TaxID=2570191 RepID=UPI00188598BD|nr:response regulator transcription factor [Thauera sp. 2A1]KAI5914732.1 response regulator transcription factor [Thauera sp. 2A1]